MPRGPAPIANTLMIFETLYPPEPSRSGISPAFFLYDRRSLNLLISSTFHLFLFKPGKEVYKTYAYR